MVPMNLSNEVLLQYLAIAVATPLLDWLWRVLSEKKTRLAWPSDAQLMVILIYGLLLSISMLCLLLAMYVANRANLIYHHYAFRTSMYHAGGVIMSFVSGLIIAIICRYVAHTKPRPMHASSHPHSNGRWYAYQLEHDGPDRYSLHFKRAGLIGLFTKCDVSLKVHPDIALKAVLEALGPGKTLVLATPNADLYWAVKRHRAALELGHPQIAVKPYAKPLNCFIGAFANWRNKWGISWRKAVICRGYVITT